MTFIPGTSRPEPFAPKKGKLLVLLESGWEYVCCRNENTARPIVTSDAGKGLPGNAIDYFEKQFPGFAFAVAD